MESIGQTKKRKKSHDDENEGRKFKKRSSGNATVAYLREKNDHLQEMHKEELETKSYLACLRFFAYLTLLAYSSNLVYLTYLSVLADFSYLACSSVLALISVTWRAWGI